MMFTVVMMLKQNSGNINCLNEWFMRRYEECRRPLKGLKGPVEPVQTTFFCVLFFI